MLVGRLARRLHQDQARNDALTEAMAEEMLGRECMGEMLIQKRVYRSRIVYKEKPGIYSWASLGG